MCSGQKVFMAPVTKYPGSATVHLPFMKNVFTYQFDRHGDIINYSINVQFQKYIYENSSKQRSLMQAPVYPAIIDQYRIKTFILYIPKNPEIQKNNLHFCASQRICGIIIVLYRHR